MKYQFIKKDTDTTILKYKDKEYEIKRDIDLISKLQGTFSKARTKMYVELTKQGIKREDLIIVTTKNGKRYEDNSNLTALEQDYLKLENFNIMNDVSLKYFNMNLETLINDIGLTEEKSKKFGVELAEALSDSKSPSQE